MLRRTPTLTDEQRQQRVGSRSLPPSELWPQSAKEGVRESQGLDRPRSCLLSLGKLNTGFDFVPPLELANAVHGFTKRQSGCLLKPQRTPEPVLEVLCQVRSKNFPLRSQVINHSSWRQAICTCMCISWIMSR